MRLIFSSDENIWYWERDSDWQQSQSFDTEDEAQNAKRENLLVWHPYIGTQSLSGLSFW